MDGAQVQPTVSLDSAFHQELALAQPCLPDADDVRIVYLKMVDLVFPSAERNVTQKTRLRSKNTCRQGEARFDCSGTTVQVPSIGVGAMLL
jgi:hypothetical protein